MSQRSTPIGCGFGCGFLFEEKILFVELPCQKTIVFIGELPSISTPAKYPFWGFFRFPQFLRFIISYILTFRSYICILETDISEKIVGFRKGVIFEASFICITVMFFFNTAPVLCRIHGIPYGWDMLRSEGQLFEPNGLILIHVVTHCPLKFQKKISLFIDYFRCP